jgi:methylphosphotriester-DNA--protein-cysteine methyltransferase
VDNKELKMKKKLVIAIFILLYLAATLYAANADIVVFITKTGKSYHLEKCASLKKSKIQVSLKDAVSKDLEPCKRCKPPVLDKQ